MEIYANARWMCILAVIRLDGRNDNVADHDTLLLWGFIKNQPKVFMTAGSTKFISVLLLPFNFKSMDIWSDIDFYHYIFECQSSFLIKKFYYRYKSCQQYD